ncbi:apolipo protein O-domain-containing protein [Podospora didyma]|uniref:MICOS complex subunit n=1 Tax=Podospora didyma TaxID=330526 RepID=A0AAE0U8S1_9PEZI|nr:apolipo protein O-domain-containing protein [Podospora didyma]
MTARVLLQRRVAPLTAAMLVGGIAFSPAVALAEAPAADRHSSKKPIYDDDYDFVLPEKSTPPTTTASSPAPATPTSALIQSSSSNEVITIHPRGATPTDRLAAQIRHGRLFLYQHACAAEDAVNGGMSRAFDLERSFTSTIASLAPPRESGEKLMPGLIYVLVAGMAGSIMARNRNVVLRAGFPLTLGLGAAYAVIPVTMRNVGGLVWEYERRFPAVADAHLRTREGVEKSWTMAKLHTEIAASKVTETVGDAREKVEGWVRKGK